MDDSKKHGCHTDPEPVSPIVLQMQGLEKRIKLLESKEQFYLDKIAELSFKINKLHSDFFERGFFPINAAPCI